MIKSKYYIYIYSIIFCLSILLFCVLVLGQVYPELRNALIMIEIGNGFFGLVGLPSLEDVDTVGACELSFVKDVSEVDVFLWLLEFESLLGFVHGGTKELCSR